MVYSDPAGYVKQKFDPICYEEDDDTSLEMRVRYFAYYCTEITERNVQSGANIYTTFDAHVDTKLFSQWRYEWKTMMEAVELYSYYLHVRIYQNVQESDSTAFWIMSENHIYSEMMAHCEAWFSLGKGNTEIADLNVDEQRKMVLLLMQWYSYDFGNEVIYK